MKKSFRTQCVLRTVLSEDKNGAYTKQERCLHKVGTVHAQSKNGAYRV